MPQILDKDNRIIGLNGQIRKGDSYISLGANKRSKLKIYKFKQFKTMKTINVDI